MNTEVTLRFNINTVTSNMFTKLNCSKKLHSQWHYLTLNVLSPFKALYNFLTIQVLVQYFTWNLIHRFSCWLHKYVYRLTFSKPVHYTYYCISTIFKIQQKWSFLRVESQNTQKCIHFHVTNVSTCIVTANCNNLLVL